MAEATWRLCALSLISALFADVIDGNLYQSQEPQQRDESSLIHAKALPQEESPTTLSPKGELGEFVLDLEPEVEETGPTDKFEGALDGFLDVQGEKAEVEWIKFKRKVKLGALGIAHSFKNIYTSVRTGFRNATGKEDTRNIRPHCKDGDEAACLRNNATIISNRNATENLIDEEENGEDAEEEEVEEEGESSSENTSSESS